MGIEQSELIIIILGLLAAMVLVVIERLGTGNHAAIKTMLEGMATNTDTLLAKYGDRLRPIYEVATLAESLIDDPDDLAVKELPPEVIEAAQTIVDFTQRFTDGEPPQENVERSALKWIGDPPQETMNNPAELRAPVEK